MKNITIQQALVLLACIAAPIVAYKFLGSPEAAAASMVVGMVLNFLLGRSGPDDPPPPKSPDLRALSGGLSAFMLGVALSTSGCAAAIDEPKSPDEALAKCRAEARAAYQTGDSVDDAMAKYEACKKREGVS